MFKYGLSGSLCDDMGLGKTIQSLCSLGIIYQNGEIKNNSLVVCPNSLLFHWAKECKKYISQEKFLPIVVSNKDLKNGKSLLDLR